VDIALSELTNGIPETVDHDEDYNANTIWERLIAAQKEGSRLGAGSPSHPEGDRAKSKTGIVQGHAYSVLKLMKAD